MCPTPTSTPAFPVWAGRRAQFLICRKFAETAFAGRPAAFRNCKIGVLSWCKVIPVKLWEFADFCASGALSREARGRGQARRKASGRGATGWRRQCRQSATLSRSTAQRRTGKTGAALQCLQRRREACRAASTRQTSGERPA